MGLGNIYIRQALDNDENELIQLYNRNFKPVRTVSQWRWEFRETPAGETIHFVICDKEKIIGQMILIPIYIKYENRKLLSGRAQALVVEKSYRFLVAKKDLVNQLIKAVIKEAKFRNIAIIWGFPLKLAIKTFEQNGFVTDEVKAFRCNLTIKTFLTRVEAKLLSFKYLKCVKGLSLWAKLPTVKGIKSSMSRYWLRSYSLYQTKDAEHIEKVWRLVERNDELTLDRSSKFIHWRYLANPFFKNEIYIIKEGSKDCGFVILGYRTDSHVKKGFIVDFCMDLPKGKLVDRVFDLVLHHFFKNGVDQVVIWNKRHDDRYFKNLLIRNGFREGGTAANFNFFATGHGPITQTLIQNNIWALSMAYMEGTSF